MATASTPHHNSGQLDTRRTIAARCLVAADVDKTILGQNESERSQFLRHVAPQLLDSARLGIKLAVLTGNSMPQLTERFLKWLLEQLCHADDLALLGQFHFFCNSGGVYFHFPGDDPGLARFIDSDPDTRAVSREVLDLLTERGEDGARVVRPRYVDAAYLARTQIPADESVRIEAILEECGKAYYRDLVDRKDELSESYDFAKVSKTEDLAPAVDLRPVLYDADSIARSATVQLTLKPILSFRYGRTEDLQTALFEKDLRTDVIRRIQRALDAEGLGHYEARAGGRSSIDVTLEKLDKAYAMKFLIDHLNLQGQTRQGRRFGANAIYFGDEVIVGGGNDYPVTRIPGLLVFAVNSDRALIPFLSHVFVPSSILEGPDATADVLAELNKIARSSLKTCDEDDGGAHASQSRTVIDRFKIKIFSDRIQSKITALRNRSLSPDDWQILHTFVTLMHRDDQAARHWLTILVDELDAIMTQVTETPRTRLSAIGTSHSDN